MLTQIEQALVRCNGDLFALHCRRYLAYKYPSVMSPGFVLGKEKSRIGTPDIFIPIDGYYIFCEITTKSDDLAAKFKKDILHCFSQVAVPLNKIIKIILMCNTKVSPAILEKVHQYKNTHDEAVELEIIDVENFSNRILNGYHAIVQELGIPISTGQIMEPLDFIEKYGQSGLAVSLANSFFNRSVELTDSLAILQKSDVLMLAGDPGVGKTKFALELCTKFNAANPDFKVKVIRSNGDLSIWDDLQTQLHPDSNYILLLDDANKLRVNLEYIINFKKHVPPGQQIKIILTVRSYVKSEVDSYFERLHITICGLIYLKKFDPSELSIILQSSDFNLSPRDALRIYDISKGNPRLAIMCAIAGKEDRKYLKNAATIYEKYFSNIFNSLDNLFNNVEVLKVTGVLSLFKSINFNDDKQIDFIEKVFGIENKKLREICIELDRIEIAEERYDIYKISDQILGEYLFHKVFIEEQYLPFSILLDMAYDKSEISIGYIMNPIIANYGFQEVKSKIGSHLKQKWKIINCETLAFRFLKDFWQFLPTETLKYLQTSIDKYEDVPYENFKFEIYEPNHFESFQDRIIEILIGFREMPTMFNYAHELLIRYGLKSELLFSKLLKVYKQSFISGNINNGNHFISQEQIITFLFTFLPKNEMFFSKILLFIAPDFLRDHHEGLRNKDLGDVAVNGKLTLPHAVKNYRTSYLEFIFDSFSKPNLKNSVYDCLQTYLLSLPNNYCVFEVCKLDKKLIDAFILGNFKPDSYNDCFIVNIYVNTLGVMELPIVKSLRTDFKDRRFILYLTLDEDRIKRKEFKGKYDELQAYKRAELQKFTKGYSLEDYIQLFNDIEYIVIENKRFVRDYPVMNSVNTILEKLSEVDRDLFLLTIKKMFRYQFADKGELYNLFGKFEFNKDFAERTRKLLAEDEKGSDFLMNFWFQLPEQYFVKEDLVIYQKFIANNKFKAIWSLDIVLAKSSHLFTDMAQKINKTLDIILTRTRIGEKMHLNISLFEFLVKNYPEIFEARRQDLQELYIYAEENGHFDYDLSMLRNFLTYDLSLLTPYLESKFKKNTFYSHTNISSSNLYELWSLKSHSNKIFTIIFDYFKEELSCFSSYSSEISNIFKGDSQNEIEFLKYYINSNDDERAILLAYNVVLSIYKEHWHEFLELLMHKNDDVEFFKKINFYLSPGMSYSGSYVPRIHAAIREIEKVKVYLESKGTFKYLDHIQYLEEKLDWKNIEIEQTRKREFLSDWGYY